MKNKNSYNYKLLLNKKSFKYSLLENALDKSDLNEGIKVIKSGFLTMSKHTANFEKKFAKKLGVKHALMVNSGSSANLLAVFAACNPWRKNRFENGDEAIIQSLCWSTSLWPLVQAGLKIKFVDIKPNTLNVDVDDVISKVSSKTKLIMLINVLGYSSDLIKLKKFCKKKKIILIEDNCESLGAQYNNKNLGTFGDFGTFSFFYSHQITSGEGGMVVCNNSEDYKILKSLRSHGWVRDIKIAKKFPNLDPRYIFINSGFNLRPTDIQAAIGSSQFNKLVLFRKNRINNRKKIIDSLKNDFRWRDQFSFLNVPKNVKPSYMVFPIFLNKKFRHKKKKFINLVENKGLQTRPIISGSFVNQPATKLYSLNRKKEKFEGADIVEQLGFVIGLHTKKIEKKQINFIKNTLFLIDKI